jgi:RuvB-like protein 2
MPLDLLDRLLIIQTKNYSKDEIKQILETRCEEEDVELSEEALDFLTEIGAQTTLRYSIQLITTSSLLAAKRKASEVDLVDIRRAYSMFLDVKRSSDYLRDHQKEYLFSEEGPA